MRNIILLFFCFGFTSSLFAERKAPFEVRVYIDSAPLQKSPEGFVDGNDKWLRDSVADLKKALDKRFFHPRKGFPGSVVQWFVVDNPAKADLTVMIAARGVSTSTLGLRTSMEFYRGVVLADTTALIGVTRWVSAVLSVEEYRREVVAFSTNQSVLSAGAWTQDANNLALATVSWVMANEEKIKERRSAGNSVK